MKKRQTFPLHPIPDPEPGEPAPMSQAQVSCFVHQKVIDLLELQVPNHEAASRDKKRSARDRKDLAAIAAYCRTMAANLRKMNDALLAADRHQVVGAGELHHDASQPINPIAKA